MIAGVTLVQAIEAVGHGHATTTRDVLQALDTLGVKLTFRRLKPLRKGRRKLTAEELQKSLPEMALCCVWLSGDRRRGPFHWAVVYDGKVYDPGPGYWVVSVVEYHRLYSPHGIFISSYIEVVLDDLCR